MAEESTLPPLDDGDWPLEIGDMLCGFAGSLNVYRTMAHHPALMRAWEGLRTHIVTSTALGPDRAEIVILRTGFRLGSSYEWAQHVQRARKLGIADTRIAALRGPVAEMAADDAVLAGAVDELFDAAQLTPDSRAALQAMVGLDGVFDLMATVGFYATLGFILRTFQTPLDREIAKELAARPLGEAGT